MMYRPAGVTQTITTSSASAQTSNAVGSQTYTILVTSTQDAYIGLGDDPSVSSKTWSGITTTWASETDTWDGMSGVDHLLVEKEYPHYLSIHPGEKVAALQVTTSGTVYVSEMTR